MEQKPETLKNDFAGCWDGGGHPACCWRDAGPPPAGKRTMESLACAQGAAGWRKGRFHSSASCLKLIRRNLDDYEKYLGWWNDWFSLELLGYMIYVIHMFFMVCIGISKQRKRPTLISDAFFSAVHRFANALLAIGAGGWNEEGPVGSLVGLWAMSKWCTKVREWTNCGQLAQ